MTKTRQRNSTVFDQGVADGRKGRPFRYTKPPKPLQGRASPHLRWYFTAYAAGYRVGKLSTQPYRLTGVNPPPWVVKALIGLIGGLFIISLYATTQ